MKKIVAVAVSLLAVASMSLSVFATGGFVSSPSNNPAPEISVTKPEGAPESLTLVVTPYSERTDLSEEARTQIQNAYASIAATTNVATLAPGLKELAATLGVAEDKLAVADLFDISQSTATETKYDFTITLTSDTVEHFVALLHYTGNAWEIVENAEVKNGKLVFSSDDFSPFAIVVDADGGVIPPKTGDNSMIAICSVVMAVSAVALVSVLVVSKKKTAKEN